MASATASSDNDADILHSGLYGTLTKFCLVEEQTARRPGEATTVFTRVLTNIPMGAPTDPLCAIHRFKIWWCRPVFQHPVPPETLFLLERVQGDNEDNGKYRLILPVVLPLEGGNSFASSSVRGRFVNQGASDDGDPREELVLYSNHNETGLYVGYGEDPFALIQEGVKMATQLWNDPNTPQTTITKQMSSPSPCARNNVILEKLGWCTWNAFYTNIEGPKVVEAVRALKQEQHIPVRWMILDDGWQHITSQDSTNSSDCVDGFQWSRRLQSYREDPVKFSQVSLRQTVHQLKHDLGMEAVWVWHTLQGYWLGLNPDSEFFEKTTTVYYPHFPPGIIDSDSSASKEISSEKGIGIADDAEDYFKQYHRDYLSSVCQIDGIKVDAQGVVGILQANKPNDDATMERSKAWKKGTHPMFRLHNAISQSVLTNFANGGHQTSENHGDDSAITTRKSPSIIHCMAHAPEIFYRLPALYRGQQDMHTSNGNETPHQLPFYRAADDFYPDNPYSHGPQIVACAFNSLLFHHVSIPDWDMFATGSGVLPEILQCHAVARCISGGPIYFSSSPKEIEKEAAGNRPQWIDWICCPDGTTLPCRGTALPLPSCLLQDPLVSDAKPLVLWNTNGDRTPNAKENDEDTVTSGVFGLFHFAGCGTWDYSMLNYVSNSGTGGGDTTGGIQASVSPSVVELRPNMIPTFAKKEYDNVSFLAVSFFSQSVQVLPDSGTVLRIPLQPSQTEALAVSPLLQLQGRTGAGASVSFLDVAPLGWEGRINGAGGITSIQISSGSKINISLLGCGCFLVALRAPEDGSIAWRHPQNDFISVYVDGVPTQHYLYQTQADLSACGRDSELPTATLRKNLLEQGFVLVVVDVPSETSSHEMTLQFAI